MSTGAYDHPTFLVRQSKGFLIAAGAGGTSPLNSYPYPLRIRRVATTVRTAGTTTGAAITMVVSQGGTTTAVSTTTLGTSTIGSNVTSGDFNFLVPAGALLYLVNSADATASLGVEMEYTVDTSANWP